MSLTWPYKFKQWIVLSLFIDLQSRNLLVFLFLNKMAEKAKDSRTIQSCQNIFLQRDGDKPLHAGLQNLLLVVSILELLNLQWLYTSAPYVPSFWWLNWGGKTLAFTSCPTGDKCVSRILTWIPLDCAASAYCRHFSAVGWGSCHFLSNTRPWCEVDIPKWFIVSPSNVAPIISRWFKWIVSTCQRHQMFLYSLYI